MRQAYCHACLDQNRDAVRAFAEGLKRAENDEDKSVILSQIVSLALNLPGNAGFFMLKHRLVSLSLLATLEIFSDIFFSEFFLSC